MQRLHPATILINLFEFVRQFVVAIIFVAFSSAGRDDATFEIIMAGLGGFGVLASVYRYMLTGYAIERGTLTVRRGGLWKQERSIPLDRIQNVTIKRSLLERLLGVCSVVVETAAGLQSEAQLSSLSQDDAESLRTRLLSLVSTEKGPSFELPPALYMLTNRELITAGALQNRALWLLVSAIGFLQIGVSSDMLADVIKKGQSFHLGPGGWVAATAVLFVVGWGVSIVSTAIKYGGFRIDRYEKGLRMHYGLLGQTEVLLPLKRVQALSVVRPLLYRWFGYAEVRAEALGSFDEKLPTGGVTLSPIVHSTRVNRLVGFVYAGRQVTDITWRMISKKAIVRFALQNLVALAFPLLILGALYKPVYRSVLRMPPLPIWMWGVLACGVVAFAIVMAVQSYRRSGWQIDNEFLMVKSGVFKLTVELIPRANVQWCELTSTWLMRRANIAVVGASTATRTHDLPPIDLPDAEWLLGELTHSGDVAMPPAAIIGG